MATVDLRKANFARKNAEEALVGFLAGEYSADTGQEVHWTNRTKLTEEWRKWADAVLSPKSMSVEDADIKGLEHIFDRKVSEVIEKNVEKE